MKRKPALHLTGVDEANWENLTKQRGTPPLSVELRAKLRAALKERDGDGCSKCGRKFVLTIHHVRPRSEGGTHDLENLVLLCNRCHRQVHGEVK